MKEKKMKNKTKLFIPFRVCASCAVIGFLLQIFIK